MANIPSSDIRGNAQKMLRGVPVDLVNRGDWIAAITNSGTATSGKAHSFISIHHICRIRYMQQVSVAALYMLMRKAYDQYVDKNNK